VALSRENSALKKRHFYAAHYRSECSAPAAQLLAVIAATIDTISSAVAQFFLLLAGSR